MPPITAGIAPERFGGELSFLTGRTATFVLLGLFFVAGLGFRMYGLGVESFGEDELNKLQTVEEYRQNGLSGKNGEHPFLMKGLQTVSVSAADRLNRSVLSPGQLISPEFAVRFPVALIGSLTILLLFLVVKELFGSSIALVTSALWALEPTAIGFDRVAKEDSLVLFFFLLASYFWLRSQSVAERGERDHIRYVWLSGVAFAALMASKYNPWLLSILAAYYILYDRMQDTRKWVIGRPRWLMLFGIMAIAFVAFNPTILIPETWREMLKFSSEGRIGHDSYEYLGHLYPNKLSLWVNGVPPSFYWVFSAVKTSLPTLVLCIVGIPLYFSRRLGDGRFFIFFWSFMWFVPFTFLGGKFTRYFAVPMPLLLITASVGFCLGVKWLSDKARVVGAQRMALQFAIFLILLAAPVLNSVAVTPHFRLFTNTVGGGMAKAGTYFPHDEFYDAGSRETVEEISRMAPGHALIACEAPYLLDYYADRVGTPALDTVSLSEPNSVARLKDGDFVVITAGRRYFSNDAYQQALSQYSPEGSVELAGATFSRIYKLDAQKLATLRSIVQP